MKPADHSLDRPRGPRDTGREGALMATSPHNPASSPSTVPITPASARRENPAELRRQQYVAHEAAARRLVASYVARLDLAARLGRFGVDELFDAGRDGLWEATAFWDGEVNDHFMTYAWFYVLGRVKERRADLQRTVEPPGEFADDDAGTLPYLEQRLARVANCRRLSLAVTTLETRGLLTEHEARVAAALRASGFDATGLDGDLGLGLSELKLAAVRLLRKLHAWLRDDALFDDPPVRGSRPPQLRSMALARARSAIHHGRQGGPLEVRPLSLHPRFLSALCPAEQGRATTGDGPGRVVSFFKAASRLTMTDLSLATGLSAESLHQLARGGRLTARQSPSKMASLANALSIPPSEILFRALPEALGLFGRVSHAGDGVYVADVGVDLPAERLIPRLACPADPRFAHSFQAVARAYRLAAGFASAGALDPRHEDLEEGRGVAVEHVGALAERLHMDPGLLLLGSWPELLVLFDVVDERGRLLSEGAVDYANLVVLLRRRVPPTRGSAPGEPGLGPYVAHLLAGRPDRLLPEALEPHGLGQRVISGVLSGAAPQLQHVGSLIAALDLAPLDATRLIAEVGLASGRTSRRDDLRAVVAGVVRLAREPEHDDAPFARLNAAFVVHFGRRRRDDAAVSGLDAFVDGALTELEAPRLPELARFCRLMRDGAGEEALHALWWSDGLSESEARLLQVLVLRPGSPTALVRELGVGFHGAVDAVRRLLARLDGGAPPA